jgi:hypothetical protein
MWYEIDFTIKDENCRIEKKVVQWIEKENLAEAIFKTIQNGMYAHMTNENVKGPVSMVADGTDICILQENGVKDYGQDIRKMKEAVIKLINNY